MSKATRTIALVATLVATFTLPWIISAMMALVLSLWVPLAPLATGLLLDALYYAPRASWIPWGSFLGLLATIAAYLVRRRVSAGIIA